MERALQTSGVRFTYGTSSPEGKSNFSYPDIDLNQGQDLLIQGPSGVGKSTLLHLLTGILLPDEGEVLVKGQALNAMPESDRDTFRGQTMGLAQQGLVFIQSLSALENLALSAKASKLTWKTKEGMEWMDRLGLEGKYHQSPFTMSFGEQQRLSFIRAVQHKPDLIFADEPTAFLDDASAKNLIELMRGIGKEMGSSLIIISHDARLKSKFDNRLSL